MKGGRPAVSRGWLTRGQPVLAVRSERSSGPRGLEGVNKNVRCYDSDYGWASCLGVSV